MENKPKIKLVILSGPSGGGKSTICNMLINKYPKLAVSVSSTTRERRTSETHGISYFFITGEEFSTLVDNGEMLEWAEVHGKRYGTKKEVVENLIQKGKIVLFDIDVQGMRSLCKTYPNSTLSIFLLASSEKELISRLRTRATDSDEEIQKRVENSKEEIQSASDFDYRVTNSNLEETFGKICKILEKELKIYGKS